MTDQMLTIDIPKTEWMSSNGREHRMDHARRTAALRARAAVLSRRQLHAVGGAVLVAVTCRHRGGTAPDVDGCAPAVKAVIDGMTDAGIWPDDNAGWVKAICYMRPRRDPALPVGWHGLDLRLIDQCIPWMEEE